MATPFVRWAGSKRQLVPNLVALMPEKINTYIEPFFGSGCLYFKVKPKKAILSDINLELISVYQAVRKSPLEVSQYLESIPHSAEAFYQLRAIAHRSLDKFSSAARFIFLMKSCFNGVYRTNMSGQFNTPYSGIVNKLPTLDDLENVAKLLKTAKIRHVDFEETINSAQRGDYIYADPPYPSKVFRGEYGYKRFEHSDWIRLVNACERANQRGALVMVSFCDSDWLKNCFPDWRFETVSTRRTVSANPMKRKPVDEVVIYNY